MKSTRNRFIKYFLAFLLLQIASPSFGEPFRVAKLHIINIIQDVNFEAEAELGLNDALAIYLPQDRDFIEGLEIAMTIPEETALWRDSCACYVYENINPLPSKEQIDFSGNKIFFGILPGKLSWIIQVPFKQDNNLKTNQYTTKLDKIPNLNNNFVFLRLQQIMKGIPDSVMESKISMKIKPIFSNQGKLVLNITEEAKSYQTTEENPQEEAQKKEILYSIYIDDKPVEYKEKGILLDTGVHNLSIISENYRTEVRTVRIEEAKISTLDISLKGIEPTIIITAPEGAAIYIDENLCTELGKEFLITEGEHKIKCTIGDYEIVRSITVIKGKTYKVNLAVDLEINENLD